MIDYEVGAIDLWLAFNRDKPFPLTLYRHNGTWCHHAYPNRTLSDKERIELEAFVKDRVRDLMDMWKPNMGTRLRWELSPHDGSKKKK